MPVRKAMSRINNMNCKQVKKHLLPFIDQELNEKISSQIDAHLHSCPLCYQEFKAERRIESALRKKMVRDQAPLLLRQKLIQHIDRQNTKPSLRSTLFSFFQSRQKRTLASVTVIAAIIVSFYIYQTVRTPYFPIFQEALNNHTTFLAGGFPLEITSSGAKEVSSWFQEQVDFPVSVPEFPGEGIELVGGKLIQIKDQDVVYLFYRGEEYDFSFLIHDCTEGRLPSVRSIEMRGQSFDVLTSDGYNVVHLEDNHERACTIVSDMDLQLLLELFLRARPSLA